MHIYKYAYAYCSLTCSYAEHFQINQIIYFPFVSQSSDIFSLLHGTGLPRGACEPVYYQTIYDALRSLIYFKKLFDTHIHQHLQV